MCDKDVCERWCVFDKDVCVCVKDGGRQRYVRKRFVTKMCVRDRV